MNHYKITCLEYGSLTSPSCFLFDELYRGGEMLRNPFSFLLLQGGGHNILVDSGYAADNSRQVENWAQFHGSPHSSVEILADLGIDAKDIDTVLITHAHTDHLGGIGQFPNATIYIQRKEIEAVKQTIDQSQFASVMSFFDPEDLIRLQKADDEGRVVYLDGECDNLLPGIDVRVSEMSHSFCTSIFLVHNEMEDGSVETFVLAGDEYRWAESVFGENAFIPAKMFCVGSPYNMMNCYKKIYEWTNGDPCHAVSLHDGSLQDRVPTTVSKFGLNICRVCD